MTTQQRKDRVDMLFKQIALIAEVKADDPKTRDELIKPLSEQLWDITQQQKLLHEHTSVELDHMRSNQSLT